MRFKSTKAKTKDFPIAIPKQIDRSPLTALALGQEKGISNLAIHFQRYMLACFLGLLSAFAANPADASWSGYPKKESVEVLRQRLSPLQFQVTQENSTEKPFQNAYWDNHEAGIYVDVVSGEPLFSSLRKFDSGTGWPSFTQPIEPGHIKESRDFKLLYLRVELRSVAADSHLGHVFDDGPKPTGKRYCINSASLRFIPVNKLEAEGYGNFLNTFGAEKTSQDSSLAGSTPSLSTKATPSESDATTATAIFAGGCFWCMEPPFEKLPGVVKVVSGYTGGNKANPTYEEVSAGGTGHAESVEVTFRPKEISYEQLLDVFWRNIDPTSKDRQFVDVGSQYRSAIFYLTPAQQQAAESSKKKWNESGRFGSPIVTEISAASQFYPAEEYHQDYYKKNPGRYHYYRWRSGRDQYLDKVWGTHEADKNKP